MFYDLTIRTPYQSSPRKIADIKALRETTRMPTATGTLGGVMGLTEAKNAIEHSYSNINNEFVLRLTPEQYAAFEYNYRFGNHERGDWYVDSCEVVFPAAEKRFFTV